MSQLLTAQELADELRLTVPQIHRMRIEGNGPRAVKVGRYLRFRREEVDRWLAERDEAEQQRYSQAK